MKINGKLLAWLLGLLLIPNLEMPNPKREIVPEISPLHRDRGQDPTADFQEARLRLAERRWFEAADLLERARENLGKPDLLPRIDLLLGQCCEQIEDPARMHSAYQRVAEVEPNNPTAYLGMGNAHWLRNQLDDAVDNYRKAMALGPLPVTAWLDLARLEMQRQLQREPGQRRWALVEQALEQAAATDQTLEITLLRAELLSAQQQDPQVQELLDDALAGPLAADPCRKAALLAARSRLDEARMELTEKLQQLKLGVGDRKLGDQARLLGSLAEVHFRLGNVNEGRSLCEELARHPEHQSDLRLRLLLLDLALEANDEAGIEQALSDVHTVERINGPFSRLGQALRLLWQARQGQRSSEALHEARKQLDQAARLRPDWLRVSLARAQLAEMQGDREGVIEQLQQALDQGEDRPSVIRRLLLALHQNGQSQEVAAITRKLNAVLRVQSTLGRPAASTALREGDPARGLRWAGEVAEPRTQRSGVSGCPSRARSAAE